MSSPLSDSPSYEILVEAATRAREHAYAPYSKYLVGAAVQARSGQVYAACNVENVSYGLTICAERAAIFKAVSEGETEFIALAVATSNGGVPCGACRQVFFEFAPRDAPVIVSSVSGDVRKVFTLAELLPDGFGRSDLPSGE